MPGKFQEVELGKMLSFEQDSNFPQQRSNNFLTQLPSFNQDLLSSNSNHSKLLLTQDDLSHIDISQDSKERSCVFEIIHIVDCQRTIQQALGCEGYS